eukprot:gnl/Spiro4/29337_TR14358_c0_g1_i2.p1 gnl/Spiro4/29337_TR14358_c0_g1~~gnl/Spiro4/29337_TR14358_c0_g1_i2.p1  ORF type:complete len:673 (-),score=154.02 gnl/Spiro4/29337_TR14358_c0_g1_i2:89-2107(-)
MRQSREMSRTASRNSSTLSASPHSPHKNMTATSSPAGDPQQNYLNTTTGHNLTGNSARDKRTSTRDKEKNPFRVPSDTEIFALHNIERARRLEERREMAARPIHLKHTKTTKIITRKMPVVEDLPPDPLPPVVEIKEMRKEKESIAKFLQKKRDMFKVQMLLETKKEEIKNLERVARQREADILRREKELEADRSLFEDFLKENDNRAADAAKEQDAETKARHDKLLEIKKVNGTIVALRAEIDKGETDLENCKRYKEFLDRLTPKEWLDEHDRLRQQKRAEALEAKRQRVMDEWSRNGAKMLEEAQRAEALRVREVQQVAASIVQQQQQAQDAQRIARRDTISNMSRPSGSGPGLANIHPSTSNLPTVGTNAPAIPSLSRQNSQTIVRVGSQQLLRSSSFAQLNRMSKGSKALVRPPSPSEIQLDEDEEFAIEEELQKHMYFTRPEMLLDMLKELEDANLFLIQNSQETAGQLEDLKHNFASTQTRMDKEVAALNTQLIGLKKDIELEKQTGSRLRELASRTDGFGDQEEFLERIKKKVTQVHNHLTGFEVDTKVTTGDDVLQMLTNIERQMQQQIYDFQTLMDSLSETDAREARAFMSQKEKNRREAQLKEKLREQQAYDYNRMQRALATALAPVKKKFGKPIMARSQRPPLRRHRPPPKQDGESDTMRL